MTSSIIGQMNVRKVFLGIHILKKDDSAIETKKFYKYNKGIHTNFKI